MADKLSDDLKRFSAYRGTPTGKNDLERLKALENYITRSRIATQLGLTYDGERDLYTALGYKKDLVFEDYWCMYKRGSLGKRVINAPVESTWRKGFRIQEDEKEENTHFEEAWKELDKTVKISPKLVRLDKLVGLGDYAVLLLGFDDGARFQDQVEPRDGLQLLYVQPYRQDNAVIDSWDEDKNSPRYGLPIYYRLSMSRPYNKGSHEERVHYSRILHVAEGVLENDIVGTPRMESVYNRIEDLQKLAGGSAEMFWQGALGGKAFVPKEGASTQGQQLTDLQDEIDEYYHGLRRYMRLTNMDVQDISPSVEDPNPHIDAQVKLISGDTGIPQRILTGSERGELASTQDESNWLSRIKERREQYAEPVIIRQLIDYLIVMGVLPEPVSGEYTIQWEDLWSASAKEKAEVSKLLTESLASYVNASGADSVIPVEFFLEEFLNLSAEQVERITTLLESLGYSLQDTAEEEEEKRMEMFGQSGGTSTIPEGGNAPGSEGEEED